MDTTRDTIPFVKIITITSRIERVVMLSIIQLLLRMMSVSTPILWTTIIIGSINILCMTLLHTMPKVGTATRLVYCIRRVTLFIFSHAIMRATMSDTDGTMQSQDPKDRLMLIIKGVTVLAALTLIPESITSEDDGDQFTSQIVYAFSTNVEGILDPLRDSRVFAFVAFAVIVYSPYVRVMLRGTPYNSRVVLSICDVANLVFFDAFTGVAFVETGDPFGDIAVILGVFGLLWNFHGVSSDLQGIQQFTTWRTATFISKIFNEVGLNDLTLATLVFTTVSILTHTPQLTRSVPWVTDLLFLIGLSGFISYVTRYVSLTDEGNGLTILVGFIIIITTINNNISQMARRAVNE
jgi:hypothetical protein